MKIFQVDSFTAEPFKGNPAGVCLLETTRPDSWMQNIAMEMNMSETAFILKEQNGFRLRWFTPATEVSLCGHATLASAHILWEQNILKPEKKATFYTKSGELAASKTGDLIELDFPARNMESASASRGLIEALNLKPKSVKKYTSQETILYLIEVESEDEVVSLNPDFLELKKQDAKGIMVTSVAKSRDLDFVSRFFAPGFGIDEDPVTGSAHCYLTPYWAKKLNKDQLKAFQASKRGGYLYCRLSGKRVYISGKAVTVFKGELKV